MTKLFHVSPHITRIFTSAPFQKAICTTRTFLFWVICLSVLFGNIALGLATITHNDPIISPLLSHPFSPNAHLSLASYFKTSQHTTRAQKEVNITKDLLKSNSPSVLGVTHTIQNTIASWESEPVEIKQRIAYWNQIRNTHPDYRDAYIQEASLYWRLGNSQKALELLSIARAIDPSAYIPQFGK